MSRCFPYPPPGYSRNGATYEALIESIKLQKETDKAKAERKKEKRARKEKKKEKEKRKDEEKGKSQNNPNEYQPDAPEVLQGSDDFKEARNKRREPSTEQLEKSDITEEHGQPLSSRMPSYSSDSTQNSNKRKRDEDSLSPGTSAHGKPIKIRLLKKHQGPDSSKETLCSNSGRTDPPSICGADARVNTWKFSSSGSTDPSVPSASNSVHGLNSKARTSLVSSNRKTSLPAPSETKTNDMQGLHLSRNQPAPISRKPILPASHLKYEIPSSNSNETELPTSSGSKKNDMQGLHSSRKQLAPSSGRPILPSSHYEIPSTNSNETELPAPSGSRSDVQGLNSSRKQLTPSSGRRVLPPNHLTYEMPWSNSNKTAAPAPSGSKIDTQGLHSVSQWSTPSSGRPALPPSHKYEMPSLNSNMTKSSAPLVPEIRSLGETLVPSNSNLEDAGPSRFEKKMQKKHAKYEKLIGGWVPPVFQAQLSDAYDDQDWLSRSDKTCRSSGDDVETCRESAACSLWRPCAQFLPEADIYALPYTVPF